MAWKGLIRRKTTQPINQPTVLSSLVRGSPQGVVFNVLDYDIELQNFWSNTFGDNMNSVIYF